MVLAVVVNVVSVAMDQEVAGVTSSDGDGDGKRDRHEARPLPWRYCMVEPMSSSMTLAIWCSVIVRL